MIDKILNKCLCGQEISNAETEILLGTTDEIERQKIFYTARKIRQKHFSDKVFLYGFVYFSTYCKNQCSFCYYKCSNKQPERYRKSIEEVVQTAVELKNSGVHLIDLTMGEDEYFLKKPSLLADMVRQVKKATNLPVMISPGLVSEKTTDMLKNAGADWYALYQETHNRQLFESMRVNQSFDERINAKIYANEQNMLIEEGLLLGIGDTKSDMIESFAVMRDLNASQVRAMTFVPQEGTDFEGAKSLGFDDEILAIAVMRILFPDKLIPASLDVDGIKGLQSRLNAGANVVTSIIPPLSGYKGVANAEADIDEGFRTVEGIKETLEICGLGIASAEDYKKKVEQLKFAQNKLKKEA